MNLAGQVARVNNFVGACPVESIPCMVCFAEFNWVNLRWSSEQSERA